jgi:hypothetical protein
VEPASQAQVQGPLAVRWRDDAQDVQGHRAAAAAAAPPLPHKAKFSSFPGTLLRFHEACVVIHDHYHDTIQNLHLKVKGKSPRRLMPSCN